MPRRQADRQSLAKVGAQLFVGSLVEANGDSNVPGIRWNSLQPDAAQPSAELGGALLVGRDLRVGAHFASAFAPPFFSRFLPLPFFRLPHLASLSFRATSERCCAVVLAHLLRTMA